MNTIATDNPASQSGIESRIVREGYGPGAWHGADLKASLDDVTHALAYWRPAAERHCIAEVALHHAYTVRNVRAKLSGQPAEPFVMAGDDWFTLDDETTLSWTQVLSTVASQQASLDRLVADIEAGSVTSPLPADERFDLVLGITCHAVYHAGQIQLVKRLHEGAPA